MKLNLDLSIHFWIGLVIFLAAAISTGTIHLTNAIPDIAIPYVTAWAGIFNVVGSGYLTTALALHNASPEAKVKLVDELAKDPASSVVGVVTTDDVSGKALAASIPGNTTVTANSIGAVSVSKDSVPPLQPKVA
jgi:hypothetical protein